MPYKELEVLDAVTYIKKCIGCCIDGRELTTKIFTVNGIGYSDILSVAELLFDVLENGFEVEFIYNDSTSDTVHISPIPDTIIELNAVLNKDGVPFKVLVPKVLDKVDSILEVKHMLISTGRGSMHKGSSPTLSDELNKWGFAELSKLTNTPLYTCCGLKLHILDDGSVTVYDNYGEFSSKYNSDLKEVKRLLGAEVLSWVRKYYSERGIFTSSSIPHNVQVPTKQLDFTYSLLNGVLFVKNGLDEITYYNIEYNIKNAIEALLIYLEKED